MNQMDAKKKGSELLFNLHWRNKLENGGDKSNIIGMYDTPATTGNFKIFKSYLLKNSGIDRDVRVCFVNHNNNVGSEWEIKSQSDFEIALSVFRLKARLGEFITLILDKNVLSESGGAIRKHSNDVETQFDSLASDKTVEPAAPEWFLDYMAKFKHDVIEEITASVVANLQIKEKEEPQKVAEPVPVRERESAPVASSSRRHNKHEHKRRKLVIGETIDKELLRNLKFERKLEMKLDKLDAKSKKLKEKKQALINKIEVDDQTRSPQTVPRMNATLVVTDTNIPHMIGGELYLHIWDVKNTGLDPWTRDTELRLNWGSADMRPLTNVIKCPLLQPGETGSICVHFDIPKKPGSYESYWLFYDKDVRFGNWLSCCVIVDAPYTWKMEDYIKPAKPFKILPNDIGIEEKPIFINEPKFDAENQSNQFPIDCNAIDLSTRMYGRSYFREFTDLPDMIDNINISKEATKILTDFDLDKSPNKYGIHENELIVDLSNTKPEIKLENIDVQQTENLEQSNKQQDTNNNEANNESSEDSSDSDISSGYDVITGPVENEYEFDGVYVTGEDHKPSSPSAETPPSFDYLERTKNQDPCVSAERLQIQLEDLELTVQKTRAAIAKCSTSTSTYSDANSNVSNSQEKEEMSRLFIFPQSNPGFEVVPPTTTADEAVFCPTNTVEVVPSDPLQTYTWAQSKGHYALAEGQNITSGVTVPHSKFDPYGPMEQQQQQNKFVHIPNYQQSTAPSAPPSAASSSTPRTVPSPTPTPSNAPQMANVHILPENLVTGAVNVASSAINTARSVINMIVPKEPGTWVNGHWVTENHESVRGKNLRLLNEMGFWDTDLNATLLARYKDDMTKVISELV